MRSDLRSACRFPALLLLVGSAVVSSARGQWELEQSNTRAALRGVASVGGGVAWASGTNGTVIRTEDGGYVWQGCAVPPGAAKLDFRAIQAWDELHALVMSSGKGELSRVYRTSDGCRSWTPVLTNTDRDGFWDAMVFADREHGAILGDPVGKAFVLLLTADGGQTWRREPDRSELDVAGEGAFAASNSALVFQSAASLAFCTGGVGGAYVVTRSVGPSGEARQPGVVPWQTASAAEELVNFNKVESSGCFSLAASRDARRVLVGVGGDYKQPAQAETTAWTTAGSGAGERDTFRFAPAKAGPRGYRSGVAYWAEQRAWVAVGPTGTDVSTDDGVTWRALLPRAGEPAGSDAGWNAVSLPFAVGPNGRVGKLRGDVLPQRWRAKGRASGLRRHGAEAGARTRGAGGTGRGRRTWGAGR